MRKWKYILLLFVLGAQAQNKMSDQEANKLRDMVKDQANATKTITCDFVQYKHLDFLSNDIESQGRLAFKAPDLVKWEYVKPFDYTVIFKNQTLFINDDGNKSNMDFGSNTIFKQLNQLIAASIRGDMFEDADFDISYYHNEHGSLVYFLPKNPRLAEFIKAFHITFTKTGQVEVVKMIEPSDDFTRIVFSNRKENISLSDAVFNQ